jgi:hypothetical protein
VKVDPRAGSKDLITPLRNLGVTVESEFLPAGDVEILGKGPRGRPVLIGVEHKQFEDAIACMRNGRFADQLRGMRESYEISWLLIEGRIGNIGAKEGIAVRRGERWFPLPGRVTYQELAAWLQTMCQAGGVLLWRTETQAESVLWLRALEMWWTVKEYEQHRAHLDTYMPLPVTNPFDVDDPIMDPKNPMYWAYRVASRLPHLGSTRAEAMARHFGSTRKIVLASAKELTYVDGVGFKVAKDVMDAIGREG